MGSLTQKIVLAAACFVVIFGSLVAAIYSKYNEKEATLGQVEQLKQEIRGYQAKIDQKPAKQKLKEDIEDVFTELVDILPQASPRQRDNIFDAVTQYAAIAKIRFKQLIQDTPVTMGGQQPPQPQGPAKPFGDAFEQTNLSLRFEGTFTNFMKFLNMVENHRNFLRVDEIALSPIRSDVEPRILDITVKFSTFHYVVR